MVEWWSGVVVRSSDVELNGVVWGGGKVWGGMCNNNINKKTATSPPTQQQKTPQH